MATVDSPTSNSPSAQVDPTQQALRATARPFEYNTVNGVTLAGGHYAAGGLSTAVAPNGGVIMGNFRFTDSSRVAVILRAWANVTVATAVTAQRNDPLLLKIARSYTVDDSTNGTALTLTGNNAKRRSNMATCIATMRMGANAAGMTGGTSTVDSNAVGQAMFNQALIAVGSGMVTTDLYKWDKTGGDYPIVLSANEGLQLLWGTTTLATGTVVVGFGVEWAEVPAF
jgi:hypothetical protein